MKTAVEQLIEEMQSYSYKVSKEDNLDMVAAFDYAIGIAKKYKEKEKEQIIEAYEDGRENQRESIIDVYKCIIGEFYYNQTYNQNES
jgi:hypothetical protein